MWRVSTEIYWAGSPCLTLGGMEAEQHHHLLLAELIKSHKTISGEGKSPQGREGCRIGNHWCRSGRKGGLGIGRQALAGIGSPSEAGPGFSLCSLREEQPGWQTSGDTLQHAEQHRKERLCRKGIESVRALRKKERGERCRKELFAFCCFLFRFLPQEPVYKSVLFRPASFTSAWLPPLSCSFLSQSSFLD